MPSEQSPPESGRVPPGARKAAARTTAAPLAVAGSPGSPPQKQVRFGLDGPRCPISPRQATKDGGPVLGRCVRCPVVCVHSGNPEAEAEAEAEGRFGPWLLRAKSTSRPAAAARLPCLPVAAWPGAPPSPRRLHAAAGLGLGVSAGRRALWEEAACQRRVQVPASWS
jgi:hypothetical protein